MKKSTILFLCLLTLSMGTTLKSQNNSSDPRSRMSLGIKAGVNISNIWDASGENFVADNKTGFAGGIFLGFPIGKFLGFQPEILFSQKGLKASGTMLGAPYSFTKTTSYIDIPLQLQLKPIRYLTIVAGPQYSYLIKEKNEYNLGTTTNEQIQEFENDNIRKNVLGFVMGADINVSGFLLSGRVGWDIQNNHGDGTSSTPRYKNQWLQFTAGLKF